jgi:drug/metabolite transporter (DMT)-like permease
MACAIIWGTTWYAIRVCIGPDGYPTYAAAAWRFTLSSTVLAVIWLSISKKIKRPSISECKWITIAGALSGVAYGLLYASEEHISGGLAAVISATSPLMAALLAMRMKLESPRRATILGSVIAIAGVAFVFHDRTQISAAQASAVGILLFNSLLNSSSNALMKRHGHHVVALASNTVFFASASVILWGISFCMRGNALPMPLPIVPTLALLHLTIFGTLIAFASFFYLLKHTRLSTAMTLSFVTPMIALLIDAFFEKHNVLTPETYLGIAVVLIGVIISVVNLNEARSV